MICVSKEPFGRRGDKQMMNVIIVADDTPDPLPTSGENVTGMSADEVFAPFSVLYVVSTEAAHQIYLANESGEFVAQ